MSTKRIIVSICIFMTGCMLFLIVGCNSDSSSADPSQDPAEPSFDQAAFTSPTVIDNPYLPLNVGTVQLYQKETDDGVETIVVEVLEETKEINGVNCVVVHDRVFEDELPIEDTYDWYAQDDDGNVWYMGEDVINYEYDDDDDLIETNSEGAWEAGVDGALPGIIMKATIAVGDSYRQEFYEGKAEDMAKIEATGVSVELEDGTTYDDCLQTLEWNPLESGDQEYKYYAPNVGLIKEAQDDGDEITEQKGLFITGVERVPDFDAATFTNPTTVDNTWLPLIPGTILTYASETEDGVETITTEVLGTTRTVNGVACVIFRDQVFLEGVIIEDTRDWFAQDDDGNVWYMGEAVVNYEYDDDGNLIDTNNDGAWEAGVDGALPGIVMWADPQAGASYYQEYDDGEAEDMGSIVATDISVDLSDGSTYDSCLQVLDWNPLDPAVLEYKYFAPGVGIIKEAVVGGDEVVEIN